MGNLFKITAINLCLALAVVSLPAQGKTDAAPSIKELEKVFVKRLARCIELPKENMMTVTQVTNAGAILQITDASGIMVLKFPLHISGWVVINNQKTYLKTKSENQNTSYAPGLKKKVLALQFNLDVCGASDFDLYLLGQKLLEAHNAKKAEVPPELSVQQSQPPLAQKPKPKPKSQSLRVSDVRSLTRQ